MTGPILDEFQTHSIERISFMLSRPLCRDSCTQAHEEQRVVVVADR